VPTFPKDLFMYIQTLINLFEEHEQSHVMKYNRYQKVKKERKWQKGGKNKRERKKERDKKERRKIRKKERKKRKKERKKKRKKEKGGKAGGREGGRKVRKESISPCGKLVKQRVIESNGLHLNVISSNNRKYNLKELLLFPSVSLSLSLGW
jgi:hypothetical protein